jgi:Carboxypeptidase regulatory-like domain
VFRILTENFEEEVDMLNQSIASDNAAGGTSNARWAAQRGTRITSDGTLRRLFFVGIALIAFCSVRAFAQMDEGAIIGTVTDTTGAVIPNAQVTLTNTGTGLVLKAKTNASGDYFFAPIKTGTYTVSVSAPNFETAEQTNVVVHVTDRLSIPFKLVPGKVSETVTVNSIAPLMQTQTAETAVDINSQFLNDAPLANRNWVFIAQEAPGVTPFVGRGSGNGDFSSNGQHAEQNNYELDGVDDNTVNSDYINGSEYNLAPPPDAIAEFKLETSDYSAEIGRGHAAVMNVTTKSGTNQFHGDVWEYNRNTIFDALNWNSAKGTKVAPFHLNQFGATLGGPIIKNHLFFFGDIQESRYAFAATPSTYSVPTPRERQGDFSELLNPTWTGGSCPTVLYQPNSNTGTYKCSSNNSGGNATAPTGTIQKSGSSQYTYDGIAFAPGQNVFSPGQLDPVAQKILQMYPCPNYAAAGQPNYGKPNGGWSTGNCNSTSDTDMGPTSSNYQTDLAQWSDPIQWDGRLDWNISSRDLATFRIDYQHIINTLTSPLGPVLDGYGGYQGHNESYLSENYMISETHTFSPTLINVFTFGFNYGTDSNLQYNYNTNIAATLGMNGVPVNTGLQEGGLPSVSDGFQTFGTHGNDPAHEGQNVYQILDNVTKVIGNHSLKFGFEANPQRWYSTNASQPLGSYSYSGSFTSVTGLGGPSGNAGADFIAQGYTPSGTLTGTNNMNSASISTFTYTHFVQQYFAGYFQDDWRTTAKLTLNLGVRYEYFTPKREQNGQLANFVWLTGSVTPNGAVGSSELVFPQRDMGQTLDPNLLALLNADHVQVAYTSNPYLSDFPKANWSPRFGAAYQIDNKTVARLGAGVFMGGFEPGGGAANVLNPPFIMNASVPSLPTCTQGNYCESQYAFNNTLEGGLGGFLAAGGIEHYATFPSVSEEDPVMHMPYTIQYNLSVQRAFWQGTTATVSYVGNLGRHLVTGINNPDMPLAVTIGGQQLNGLTPAPHLSGQFWMSWAGASSYNAMQAVVQKHYGNGLSLLGSYTWGHAFDNTTDLLGGDIGSYKQAALIPIKYEWGPSGYDIRERATVDVDYDLPFGVGRPYLSHPGILDEIVGGWRTDMQWWGQTGQPFTVGISRISGWQNANGGLANSAIKVADPYSNHLQPPANYATPITASGLTTGAPSDTAANVCAAKTRTRLRWYNPCAFADPLGVINTSNATAVADLAPYATGYFSYYSPAVGADNALADGAYNTSGGTSSLGTAAPYVTGYAAAAPFFGSPKNSVSGPGNWRLNASLFKDFRTFHEQYLEFRVDAFNVLNHPSFGNPGGNTNIGANSVALTGPGSNQTNTIDARFLQFSAKYDF